jgi:putative ABC transport system substrate-binding protein
VINGGTLIGIRVFIKKIKMNRIICFITIALLIACNNSDERKKEPAYPKVSIVLPVSIDAFDNLKKGLSDFCQGKFELAYYSAEGDPAKFETTIQSALLNHPNYLVAIGTQMTNTALGPKFKMNLPILIAASISTPELVDGLVKAGIEPPRKSEIAIVSDSPKESIYDLFGTAFKEFFPRAKIVGIIYNPAEINSKSTADETKKALVNQGCIIRDGVINSAEDIEKVTNRLLLENIETMVIPLDKNAVMKAASIVKKCDEKHVPVMSLDDGTVRKSGVSIAISVNYKSIGTLIGQTLFKIESKETKASEMPVAALEKAKIYVNKNKLKDLGITKPKNMVPLIEEN